MVQWISEEKKRNPQREMLVFGCCWVMIPITSHPEPQEHLFNKSLTGCRTYSREATYVPSSLLMVYASMFIPVCLISLSASGLPRFILLPPLVILLSHCFPLCWVSWSLCFLLSHSAVYLHFCFFFVPFYARLINPALVIFNISSILSQNNVCFLIHWSTFSIYCCQNLQYINISR